MGIVDADLAGIGSESQILQGYKNHIDFRFHVEIFFARFTG